MSNDTIDIRKNSDKISRVYFYCAAYLYEKCLARKKFWIFWEMKLNQQEILDVQITQLFHEFLEFLVTFEMCHILQIVWKKGHSNFLTFLVLCLISSTYITAKNESKRCCAYNCLLGKDRVKIVLQFSVKLCKQKNWQITSLIIKLLYKFVVQIMKSNAMLDLSKTISYNHVGAQNCRKPLGRSVRESLNKQ